MEEQLIESETAIIAKEKGFDVNCDKGYYKHETEDQIMLLWKNGESEEPDCGNAPTQALLQKWLRENKDIDVLCGTEMINREEMYQFSITHKTKAIFPAVTLYPAFNFEAGFEIALREALKLV